MQLIKQKLKVLLYIQLDKLWKLVSSVFSCPTQNKVKQIMKNSKDSAFHAV